MRYDAVRVSVAVNPAVPEGFPGAADVHVAWYDPENAVANVPAVAPEDNGPRLRDNKEQSALSVEAGTLVFGPSDDATKTSYHTISGSRFVDNFVVAPHPNR